MLVMLQLIPVNDQSEEPVPISEMLHMRELEVALVSSVRKEEVSLV